MPRDVLKRASKAGAKMTMTAASNASAQTISNIECSGMSLEAPHSPAQ